MDVYAAFARFHMRRFGTTARQFAAVAAKNHRHSVDNPRAQYRRSFTVEEVLAAQPIAYPLTIPMCAPISDGAAAVIVCSKRGLERLGAAGRRPVVVRASVLATSTARLAEDVSNHVSARAARQAYEEAGSGPDEMSVAEVHDATAVGEVIQVENLGFCPFGEGGTLAERGITALGGKLPVIPSGGLLSKGHPVGATGIAQIFELVTQLRGAAGTRQVAGARFGIAENGGGIFGIEEAAASITILGGP
jgi:acetyl-CoA acetyltransferase